MGDPHTIKALDAVESGVVTFDIASLKAGQTIEFTTKSGSFYWITATTDKRVGPVVIGGTQKVYGISFMSSSKEGQIATNPYDARVQRILAVGQRFSFGVAGETSPVVRYRLF